MTGKVLASAVLGLSLLGACASETPMTTDPRLTGARGNPQNAFPTMPSTPSTPAQPSRGPLPPADNPMGLMPIAGGAPGAMGAGGSGAPKAENCGAVDISNGRVTPKVWLVIDGSGSMADGLAGPMTMPTRWDALRQALMDKMGGVVPSLDPLVKFGMVMYDGPLGGFPGTTSTLPDGGPATGMPPTDECPRLVTIEPALNNFAMLDPAIPMLAPGGSTPTHKALAQVLSHLPATTMVPDGLVDPTYVVLATDGAPNDFCTMNNDIFGGGGPGGGAAIQQEVVATTTKIASQGIPVYVISLAADDQALQAHLNAVAQAGGTMHPPFTPQNKADLVETFKQIIGPEAGCTVKLTTGFGVMKNVACMGSVMLSGEKLECDSPNGWRLVDEKTIEITGTSCEKFKMMTNARLTAMFPCEIQIPG
ncbi:MAG TPA: hypothetical protein VJV78_26875 [Polyangiales bacterium]|nr:hypothetical protein [Polyangiales bacterium]